MGWSREWPCVECGGREGEIENCAECAGRGFIMHIPYADRPWDEAMPGLFQGGHDCQAAGAPPYGYAIVTDEFDIVFSLYERWGFGPNEGVPNIRMKIGDSDLDPDRHTELDEMAEKVAKHVRAGEKVLVRCQAGLNRSGLVTALAMIKLGWEPQAAIDRLRESRSSYVLCNPTFAEYVLAQGATVDG